MMPWWNHEGHGVERVQREQHLRLLDDRVDCRDRDHSEPDAHDRAEEGGDASGAARLHGKQTDQDDHGQRYDVGLEVQGDVLHAFDRRQHRERRRDHGVAVEQGAGNDAEQDDGGPAGADCALGQRHQGQRAALAVVVGTEQDHDVFERHHDDERPQDQREHAEHRRRRRYSLRARSRHHRLAERVERAGADIAVDDADAAECQRTETGGGVGVAMPIGRRRFRGGNRYVTCHGRA